MNTDKLIDQVIAGDYVGAGHTISGGR